MATLLSSPPTADGEVLCMQVVPVSRRQAKRVDQGDRGLLSRLQTPQGKASWGCWAVELLHFWWRCGCSFRARLSISTSTLGLRRTIAAQPLHMARVLPICSPGHVAIHICTSAAFDSHGRALQTLEGWPRGLMRLHGLLLIWNLLPPCQQSGDPCVVRGKKGIIFYLFGLFNCELFQLSAPSLSLFHMIAQWA